MGAGDDTDGSTPAPEAGYGRGKEGAGQREFIRKKASGTSALAHQFCKSTTCLANIPACNHMPWLQKSGCLGEEEGGTLRGPIWSLTDFEVRISLSGVLQTGVEVLVTCNPGQVPLPL